MGSTFQYTERNAVLVNCYACLLSASHTLGILYKSALSAPIPIFLLITVLVYCPSHLTLLGILYKSALNVLIPI